MLQLLIAHFAAALAAPALVAWLGRRAFLLLASVPASAMAWALAHTSAVLDGNGPTETMSWVPALGLDLTFRLDTLSWLLVLMVGGIGAAVLVYSSRYFSSRSELGRFAAVLVGFAGAMLGLVTSENLIQLYVFWELTTVFSYLLIGYYTERATSRRAAMKAILVTSVGGLAMLAGIVILGTAAGTFELTSILAGPPEGTAVTVAIGLILLGAITKSALIPFHFWLPAAMAAPTPVSAYLHAAAMVKAGVYLVARLAPGFSALPLWQAMIAVLALLTIVHGGVRALRQSDLKLILAFSTVSQLGMLILLVGSPFKAGALAGLALLGAHALFKAALFLVVGIVDAATGTRDLDRLSGVGKRMPITAAVAALATASMIGVAPFAGYVAKEAALEAIFDDQAALAPFGWPILAVFVLGSALTIAYGLRLWWGAFATKRDVAPSPEEVVKPPFLLLAPPAVMALAGLATALLPQLGETLLTPHANAYPLGSPGHLALWSGLTPAFISTLVAFAVGALLFAWRRRIAAWRMPALERWNADRVYRYTLRRTDQAAAGITAVVQRGSLPFYVGILLVTSVVGAGIPLASSLPQANIWIGTDVIVIAAAVAAIAATVMAARARRRMKAVILVGITGYSTALIFLTHGAPDLALTQVLVETVTLVVFVLVLRRLPVYFSNRPLARTRWVRLAVATMVGVFVAGLAVTVPQARIHEAASVDLPAAAETLGGGKNTVNVTLVDIRAWDTLGEISVLLAAATGVASLIFVRHRSTERPRPQSLDEVRGSLGATEADPLALLRSRRQRPEGEARASWLVAGMTMAPQRRSVILEVSVRFLYHTMIVFAVFLLVSGHNAPGGGFVAGLVVGIAITARYLAGGRYELSAAAPLQPAFLLGSGLFLAAATGIAAMVLGAEVLESAILIWDVPLFGEVKLVTSLFFDVGVFMVVIGLVLDVLRSLGAEIDHQGDDLDEDGEPTRQALEPARTFTRRTM